MRSSDCSTIADVMITEEAVGFILAPAVARFVVETMMAGESDGRWTNRRNFRMGAP